MIVTICWFLISIIICSVMLVAALTALTGLYGGRSVAAPLHSVAPRLSHRAELRSHHMFTIKQRKCFRLTTFVYITVIIMMLVYVLLGVGGVLMFILVSEPGRLGVICLGSLLVVCLLGLVTSLLLVMGLVTRHTHLFLPWMVYHSLLTSLCLL